MAELKNKGMGGVEGRFFKNRGISTQEQGYETSLGFYGGTIKKDNEGRVVLDMRPGWDKKVDTFDRFGDPRVRSIDEHTANAGLFLGSKVRVWKNRATGFLEALHLKSKSEAQQKRDSTWEENKPKWENKPKATFKKAVETLDENGNPQTETTHQEVKIAPRSLLKLAAEGLIKGHAARYRGTSKEIARNVDRLGLGDYYGIHPWGMEIKKPEIYSEGTSLYDIIIAGKEGKEPLKTIDRTQALGEASRYIRQIHDQHGGIGELVIMDIQFQKRDASTVSDPILGLPDIVWNENATLSETAKRATDMMDFLVNLAYWEHKAGNNSEEIQRDLDTVLENYGDEKTIRAVRSFINPDRKSKKPTLPGENKFAVLHNVARLGADKSLTTNVRTDVFNATEKFLATHKTTPQPSTT